MRTIVAGSRSITNSFDVDHALAACGWRPAVVISGTARGVDRLGEDWAARNAVPVERYPADWRAHGNDAGRIRNFQMATRADALVAIWDCESPGTKNMISVARSQGLRVYVHKVLPTARMHNLPFAIPAPPAAAFVIPPPPPPTSFTIPAPPPLIVIPKPPARPRAAMDIECYRDYFLVKFKCAASRAVVGEFELYEGHDLDRLAIAMLLARYTLVTFNGTKYDMPMLSAAMAGHENQALKHASDAIIKRNMQPWQFEREFNIPPLQQVDHIDLIEVSPGVYSLKMYGGKMHSRKMQDLPIDPSASITPDLRPGMREYCGNDLEVTIDLLNYFNDQIQLREILTERYGVDMRSKSDAQIAEAAFKVELGFKVERPFYPHGYTFNYQAPAFIKYQTPQLQALLASVVSLPFVVSDKDQVESEIDHNGEKIKTGVLMPKELKTAKIKIGGSTYKLGIGGLHSTEESVCHIADGNYELSDHDVASYYPNIIVQQGLYPPQMGEAFLAIYKGWIAERLAAKRAGQKKKADGEKTKVNGTFGKTGSKYSILYAPNLLIQTTITGQLALLMLIEMLELSGISVVSANTDGIVIKTPRPLAWVRDEIIKSWETLTGFETEVARYNALYSRDVNSYIALKDDGTVKLKGAYAPPVPVGPSWPNPTGEICVDAVVAYLSKSVPLEQTIRACTDVKKFVAIRNVKGGGQMQYGDEIQAATTIKGRREQLLAAGWLEVGKDAYQWPGHPGTFDGVTANPHAVGVLRQANPVRKEYLGKAVRWYYSTDRTGAIHYASNGNLVATTEGARPCMELPAAVPADLDYDWYVAKSKSILEEIGLKGWV